MNHNKNMRGGRLRKTTLGIITFAPVLLGATLPNALAGTCTGTAGSYTCTGEEDPQTDTTQTLSAAAGESLSVTDEGAFSIHTQQGSALMLSTQTSAMGATITLDGGGSITANLHGIDLDHNNDEDISITTSGHIRAGGKGIYAYKDSNRGDISITANGHIHAENIGIDVVHEGTGNILIDVGGRIRSDNDDAVSMSGGTTQRLILRSGSRIEGGITATAGATLELADAAHGHQPPPHAQHGHKPPPPHAQGGHRPPPHHGHKPPPPPHHGHRPPPHHGHRPPPHPMHGHPPPHPKHASRLDLATLSGFNTLEKTGNGLWELTGEMQTGEEFNSVSFASGRLRLHHATLRLASGASLAVPDNGTLEVIGDTTLDGDFQPGGDVEVHLHFKHDNPGRFTIAGDITGDKTSNLKIRAHGHVDPGTNINDIIAVEGTARADAFDLHHFAHGAFAYDLGYDAAAKSWSLNENGFAPNVQTHETYPAILTQLAQLSSMLRRFGARKRMNATHRTVWGKIETSHARIEPNNSTLNSNFDIEHSRVRFGIDVPVTQAINFGADVVMGSAKTDLAAATGEGNIKTRNFTTSFSALWKHNRFYSDTQIQYANFDSSLHAENRTLASGNDASAWSVAKEIGYSFGFKGFLLTPQAQLIWNRIDFDSFKLPRHQRVSLKDGSTLLGRLGVAAASKFFHVDANLRMPLDGRTKTDVSGVTFVNEIENVAVDLGIGFKYPFELPFEETRAAFVGDLATSQGDEIESYRANLGLRFDF
ncbi:MAG: autotransporter outer membrane beta-barrel domain-containing protein [Hyphomicrobiales bacterium]|nr:autotransporter outer membrane beta-barrel domain-containing protein [Hyphomicrobiales bacterium]